ncbi:response regulator [Cohnella sp.]|uniref:response regulator transcription factor n=1 Tax=Cohnella sp. TaxID=1883426 RepID=UPI00356634A8
MRVLIVDDENHITKHMAGLVDWAKLGVGAVDTASNGLEALESYRARKPDLIITDITMPVMDGLEFLELVRQEDPEVSVLILSGYDEFEYAKKAIHLRALHYIMKPIVLPEIEQILYDVVQSMNNEAKRKRYAEEFAELIKRKLPVLREQFLNELATAGRSHREISLEQLQLYELNEDVARGALVLTLKLYRAGDPRDRSERDWLLFKFSAMNIVEETLRSEPEARAYPLRYSEDRLPIFVCGADPCETVERAKRLGRSLMANVGRYLSIESNAGVGSWRERTDRYFLSYKESFDLLRLTENEGYQLLLVAGEEKDPGVLAELDAYPEDRIRPLVEALVCRNETEAARLWTEIEAQMTRRPGSLRLAQTASIALIGSLAVGFAGRGGKLPEGEAVQPLRVIRDIQSAETKEEVARTTRIFVLELVKEAGSDDEEAAGDYVTAVKRIVETEYASSLSFAEIAARLHLSRNYLGFLFKRETGIGFIQYLTQYRIDKAKELMATKRHMISEIADKVGFADPTYFSRVFRGATGKSPLEYAADPGAD